jgi:hypothetical protein
MRARALQSAKLRELGEALIATGHLYLDDQATVLVLSRSTTWTIIRAKHKTTGLSASVIKRMLAQPHLPAPVRIKICEYVDQKSAGIYGHNPSQVRRFVEALSPLGLATRLQTSWRGSFPLATRRRLVLSGELGVSAPNSRRWPVRPYLGQWWPLGWWRRKRRAEGAA